MMFVCCHPALPGEGQIALILKTLCGFSVGEIARAFLTNEETVTKRLYRAREYFRTQQVKFEIPSPSELSQRLVNVLTSIYLLFNEGYHSTHHDNIRDHLVEESLRLCKMITDSAQTRTPESLALMALLCFHAARIKSIRDEQGNLILLKKQNRNVWNADLIETGIQYLSAASYGENMSAFHLEAAIAYEHCAAKTFSSTNWRRIHHLYSLLEKIKPNALTTLHKSIVTAELYGAQAGLDELSAISDEVLNNYYLYHSVVGDFYERLGNAEQAKLHLEKALELTTSKVNQQLLKSKLIDLHR
jgi:RNA polymerase sigma-70 factor (ECF subfamily)